MATEAAMQGEGMEVAMQGEGMGAAKVVATGAEEVAAAEKVVEVCSEARSGAG